MTYPQVKVVIKPFTLRFSLEQGVPVYHIGANPWAQLDGMEILMGVDPRTTAIFNCNLGFLPICSTVLILSDINIVVDPGNFHVGFYGMIERSLEACGLTPRDVDIVVATHAHMDHIASSFLFRQGRLVIGEGELEEARRQTVWPELIDALLGVWKGRIEPISISSELVEIARRVYVLPTPGHTCGSLSVLVDTGDERVAIVGDTAMTKEEYAARQLSHWYTAEQKKQINESLDRVTSWNPTIVVPGHDAEFHVCRKSRPE